MLSLEPLVKCLPPATVSLPWCSALFCSAVTGTCCCPTVFCWVALVHSLTRTSIRSSSASNSSDDEISSLPCSGSFKLNVPLSSKTAMLAFGALSLLKNPIEFTSYYVFNPDNAGVFFHMDPFLFIVCLYYLKHVQTREADLVLI